MVSTKQAADMLGISQVRVRELIKTGKLKGTRIGRSWGVDETSVRQRMSLAPQAGRPKEHDTTDELRASSAATDNDADGAIQELHELYLRCEQLLARNYNAALYERMGSGKEARFCAKVTDFFLQEKQRELVEAGVF